MARQKALAEQQQGIQSMPAGTIPQGLAMMAQSLVNALQRRKAERELASGQQAVAGIMGAVNPDVGPTQEQIAQLGVYDPDMAQRLMEGAWTARREDTRWQREQELAAAAKQAEIAREENINKRELGEEIDRETRQAASKNVYGPVVTGDAAKQLGLDPAKSYQLNKATGQYDQIGGGGVNVSLGPGGEKLTENQSRDLSLYSRAGNANVDLDDLENELTSLGDRAASLFGEAGQWWKSPKYKQAERAGKEVLAVILRKDSGGAITPEEMDTYGAIYLPMPGDDPQTIADKRRAREVALRSLGYSVEGAAPEMYKRANADIETYRTAKQEARAANTPLPRPDNDADLVKGKVYVDANGTKARYRGGNSDFPESWEVVK
jgi:hypothetical protein